MANVDIMKYLYKKMHDAHFISMQLVFMQTSEYQRMIAKKYEMYCFGFMISIHHVFIHFNAIFFMYFYCNISD